MNAHIFAAESNYSMALIRLLYSNFEVKENDIYFGIGKPLKNYSYSEFKGMKIKMLSFPLDYILFFLNTSKYDKIFVHYLPYDPTLVFYYINFEKVLKKSIWVVWGNDIYSYYRKDESLRTRVYEFLRKRIINRLPRIAAFVREDYNLIKKFYPQCNAVYQDILYPLPIDLEFLKKVSIQSSRETLDILVGNSADEANHHIDSLKIVSRFIRSDVRIFCPLSYGGNAIYINKVIDFGKSNFGDNFIPITELLPPSEYAELLGNIDIAIMNHDRQQALGNILALLYLNKTVVMRDDISSYFFFKRNGIEVLSFDELIEINSADELKKLKGSSENKNKVEKIISLENYVLLWKNLIDYKND